MKSDKFRVGSVHKTYEQGWKARQVHVDIARLEGKIEGAKIERERLDDKLGALYLNCPHCGKRAAVFPGGVTAALDAVPKVTDGD